MRPLAFKLVPWEFLEKSEFCQKLLKIIKNLNFAIWKKVFSNFIGPPWLNQERYSALFLFYWTTTDKLEFTDWSEVQRRFSSGEIAIFRQGGLKGPLPRTWKGKNVITRFFLFHMVHAFQNNWLDITIIQADMVWETVHRSLIYL